MSVIANIASSLSVLLHVTDTDGQPILATTGQTKSAAGKTITPMTALSVDAFYAGVRAIAEDLAGLPFHVFAMRPTDQQRAGLAAGRDRLREHPVERLIGTRPNREMSAMAFRETLTAHALTWHGGFAQIERNQTGRPVALWPLHPARVAVRRVAKNSRPIIAQGKRLAPDDMFYQVRVTREPDPDEKNSVALLPENMIHIHGLGPDGISSYSIPSLATETLGYAIAAEEFAARFFSNGAFQSGIMKLDGTLSPEAHDRLKRDMNQKIQGVGKAHNMLIFEGGADWIPNVVDPQQSQLIETQQFAVEKCARWLRIALHKIGYLKNASYNNVFELERAYATDSLMPWGTRWEQEISTKLLIEPGQFAEHNYDGLLRGDPKLRAAYYRSMAQTGILSVNEIRAKENQNPIAHPDADRHFVPMNMRPLEETDEEKRARLAGKIPPAPPGDNSDRNRDDEEPKSSRFTPSDMFQPAIAAAIRPVYTKMKNACTRHAERFTDDRPGRVAWANEFFREQVTYMMTSLMPIAETYAQVAGVDLSGVGAQVKQFAISDAEDWSATFTSPTPFEFGLFDVDAETFAVAAELIASLHTEPTQ